MDGTVTMQDPGVKCSTCKHFGNSCAVLNPLAQVNDCNEYGPLEQLDFKDSWTQFNEMEKASQSDMVNHPNHYTQGGIECIKAIEASMPPSGFQDYCKGNVLKYIWRWRDKAGLEDLKKAQVYLGWLIESVEKEQNAETTD